MQAVPKHQRWWRSPRRGAPLTLALLLSLATSVGTADIFDAPPAPRGAVELEVLKGERLLLVKRNGEVERRFGIATGRGGRGDKRRRGDHRTPIGTYRIVDVKDSSRFLLFLQLNYPNAKDAFFGLKAGRIDRRQFDRIVAAARAGALPPQDTPLGGQVGIHGLGAGDTAEQRDLHAALDWTEGCIALTNEEVEELRRLVDVGTRVVIRE